MRGETRGFEIDRGQVDEGAVIAAIERRQEKKKRERTRRVLILGAAGFCVVLIGAIALVPVEEEPVREPSVTIDSSPSGVALKINGQSAGTTPVTVKAASLSYPVELEFKARPRAAAKAATRLPADLRRRP